MHSMTWTRIYGTKEIDVMDLYGSSKKGIQASSSFKQLRSEAGTCEPASSARAQRIDIVFRGAFVSDPRRDVEVDIDYDTGDASYVRVAIRDEKPRGSAGGDWIWLDMNPDDARNLADALNQASNHATEAIRSADQHECRRPGSSIVAGMTIAERDRIVVQRLRERLHKARARQEGDDSK